MKSQIASLILCSSFACSAHAGFLDFLFGGESNAESSIEKSTNEASKPSPAETVLVPTSKENTQDSSLMSSALTLLPLLSEKLGVSESQAEGGMGALLQLAQKTLSSNEFSNLSANLPGIDEMMSAAPKAEELSEPSGNALGQLLSQAGNFSESLGNLGLLTKQFEALGLSPDMILHYARLAIDFLTGKTSTDNSGSEGSDSNGPDSGALLKKGLEGVISV